MAPGPRCCFAGDIVLRVGCEARVVDFANFGVSVEMARDRDAVGVVLQHAHGEGFEPARNQKTIHRERPAPAER